MLKSLFDRVTGLQAGNFIKKRLQHECFPARFAKFLRAPFFTEHLRWQAASEVFCNDFVDISCENAYCRILPILPWPQLIYF